MTHLSESGGTLTEARLTWVRLNAELKNWRKVGRESLAFLEKNKRREKPKDGIVACVSERDGEGEELDIKDGERDQ